MRYYDRALAEAMRRRGKAVERTLPWFVSFAGDQSEDIRRNVIDGLHGAIVGAPAMPEDFE